jgi:hypothetical protein
MPEQQGRAAQARRAPIIQNPVFASRTPGRTGAGEAQSTFRGRFAQSALGEDWRRRHHHHLFAVLGFAGPVFWPYAYDDFYDYAWWGGDYDPFWDYGYGDLYAGLFGVYDYGALNAYAAYLPEVTGSTRRPRTARNAETSATLADMCGSDSRNIAGFPVEQFRSAIQPNPEQAAALDDLANASQKAAEIIRNSCPKDVALTAPSRLAAMQQRVQAMREAVNTVEPALDKFYGLLSDEQKAKITALAAEQRTAQGGEVTASGESCAAAQSAAMPWPSEQIEREVKPTDAQRASLTALQDATTKAADILKSSCPPQDARTPPARLDAVGARLDAMLQAIGTVRPALDTFYTSLDDEQKAAFDAIGPARNGPSTAYAEEPAPRHARRHHHYHGVSMRGLVFRMMGL